MDGARVPGNAQRLVDIELSLPCLRAVGGQDSDLLVVHRAVVGDKHGGRAVDHLFHLALEGLAVGAGNLDLLAGGERVGGNVRGHIAVHGQHRQSAVLDHAGGHVLVGLGVDDLHAAGHIAGKQHGHGLVGRAAQLGVQAGEGLLGLRERLHHRGGLHGRQIVPLLHLLSHMDQHLVHLHAFGQFQRLGVRVGELPRAGNGGDHTAGVHRIGLHRGGGGGAGVDPLLDLGAPVAHRGVQSPGDQRQNDHQHDDAAAFFLPFPFSDGVKKLPVAIVRGSRLLGERGCLSFLVHAVSSLCMLILADRCPAIMISRY